MLGRVAADDGQRTSLDAVIDALGFDRAELEAELNAELTEAEMAGERFIR